MRRLIHEGKHGATLRAYKAFWRAVSRPQESQEKRLSALLRLNAKTLAGQARGADPTWSYDQFAARVPLSTYEDWHELIERQRRDPRQAVLTPSCYRFQPTSGSTARTKWIPYSKPFSRELEAAAMAWIHDLEKNYAGIKRGLHYWSLSWLPDELRSQSGSQNAADDLELLAWPLRTLLRRTMAVPSEVAYLETSADAQFATACYLAAARELSLVSVWSPTFFLRLLEVLTSRRDEVATVLEKGEWTSKTLRRGKAKAPKNVPAAKALSQAGHNLGDAAELTQKLWPHLTLVSAWDSSTSAEMARRLQQNVSHAGFQGKGLWATEGVVTIPFAGRYPVAVNSHFYEFQCLTTGKIHPVWHLEAGQTVRPILTTGSGLLRYQMSDKLRVDGWLENTPSLTFLGRMGASDFVGEKLEASEVARLLAHASRELDVQCLTLVGSRPARKTPQYVVLAEGSAEAQTGVAQFMETRLCEYHHYRLARQLGQLAAVRAVVRPDAYAVYESLRPTSLSGSVKLEALTPLADGEEPL